MTTNAQTSLPGKYVVMKFPSIIGQIIRKLWSCSVSLFFFGCSNFKNKTIATQVYFSLYLFIFISLHFSLFCQLVQDFAGTRLKASGKLWRHYFPNAPFYMCTWIDHNWSVEIDTLEGVRKISDLVVRAQHVEKKGCFTKYPYLCGQGINL